MKGAGGGLLVKTLQNQKGLTILEVIVVLVIVAVALIPLLGMFTQGKQDSVAAWQRTQATALAQSILEEVKAGVFPPIATTGSVNIDNHKYDWEMVVTEVTGEQNLRKVTVLVNYKEFVKPKELSLTMLKANR